MCAERERIFDVVDPFVVLAPCSLYYYSRLMTWCAAAVLVRATDGFDVRCTVGVADGFDVLVP